EARATIEKYLKTKLNPPFEVNVSLAQTQGMQAIRGEHLVRPDGVINLGTYGSVYVTGLTVEQAREAIEEHLAQLMLKPKISLDVIGYNSKVYYIILNGAGNGEQVYRFPVTGNETVLDAMSLVSGLPAVSSPHRIWVARPDPSGADQCQELAVD